MTINIFVFKGDLNGENRSGAFLFLPGIVILSINKVKKNTDFKIVEGLQQDQWHFSCHKIWCKITLNFYGVHCSFIP